MHESIDVIKKGILHGLAGHIARSKTTDGLRVAEFNGHNDNGQDGREAQKQDGETTSPSST